MTGSTLAMRATYLSQGASLLADWLDAHPGQRTRLFERVDSMTVARIVAGEVEPFDDVRLAISVATLGAVTPQSWDLVALPRDAISSISETERGPLRSDEVHVFGRKGADDVWLAQLVVRETVELLDREALDRLISDACMARALIEAPGFLLIPQQPDDEDTPSGAVAIIIVALTLLISSVAAALLLGLPR